MNKKHSLLLLAIGLFVVALAQITWHFIDLLDFVNGIFVGTGFGLLLQSLWKLRIKNTN